MDRNSIIGFVLIALVLVGYSYYTAPTKEELARKQMERDSLAMVAQKQALDSIKLTQVITVTDTVQLSDSAKQQHLVNQLGLFATAAQGTTQRFTLENEKLIITLNSQGGKVEQVELKNYTTHDKKPLLLYQADSSAMGLNFFAQNKQISTNALYFKPLGKSFKVSGNGSQSFIMRLEATPEKYIDYIYTLQGNSFDVKMDITLHGVQDVIAANSNYLELDWRAALLQQELTMNAERSVSTVYYKYTDDKVDYLSESESEQKSLNEKIKWVAFKQQYFSSILIAKNLFEPAIVAVQVNKNDTDIVKHMQANVRIPYGHQTNETFSSSFYFGPNHYQTLKSYNIQLEKIVPLGWGIFGWVNKFLVIPVFNWLNTFNLNFGIIILILTIIIKVALLPLTYNAYKSGAKMRVLQPEIKEIQDKHKEEPLKLQQELMGLYKKAGVSPLGGCIPLLLQMPILIAMFRFFPASIELRQESFLWATDLSTYDSIWNFGKLPIIDYIYGDHVSLFTLLMTISTLLYTHFNMQMSSAMNAQMKWMQYIMPVMFLGIFNNYSAGLSYYYFLANMISIGQQSLFRAFIDEDKIHAQIQENKKRPAANKKSAFQTRLEKMAKERGYQLPKK
ncbi:MAG: membrane protein insertase YidC [Bacteroidia bacterium]|mgnify:CR=1 FL=1|nr:membrane protein insertase YidC [Bacteroidia bacterium]HQU99911.1 membrane protein insertase YidC [Bacteroidia bacterium]